MSAPVAGARYARGVKILRSIAAMLVIPVLPAGGGAGPRTLVVCAPGYPGNTAQAQPTMDAFAKAAAGAGSWEPGTLAAVYFENEQGGLARLSGEDAVLALVPLPYYLLHGPDLGLRARLQVVLPSGSNETWGLAVKRGRVTSPSGLAGWEVTGAAGYAPAFVRGPVLEQWGRLPPSVRITFTSRGLTSLRRAASGEPVAVLLDSAQTAGLRSLPFADELEVVAHSAPLPGSLLCTIADRLGLREANALIEGLLRLHEREDGAAALHALQMTRFARVDTAALQRAERSFHQAADSSR